MTVKLLTNPHDVCRVTSKYGQRGTTFHGGIDIGGIVAGKTGDKIYAVAPGKVTISSDHATYGYYVEIDHGSWRTRYAHLRELITKVGQVVRTGDVIGYMGSTGRSTAAHLHFEIRVDGKTIDPLPHLVINPYKEPSNVLKRGSRGEGVKWLQYELRLTIDSSFGAITEEAVKSFQKKYGLKIDGLVGPLTKAELKKQK